MIYFLAILSGIAFLVVDIAVSELIKREEERVISETIEPDQLKRKTN